MRPEKRTQKGYALIEVLIAAAITASVAITITASLSISLKGTQRINDRQRDVGIAENISNAIRAGLPIDDLKRDYAPWEISLEPLDTEQKYRARDVRPFLVTIEKPEASTVKVQTIILRTELGDAK